MTTIKVTVDNKKNARLLTQLLRKMTFVKSVEEEKMSLSENQYVKLKQVFDDVKPDVLFREINKPNKWQKELRDEWQID